MIKKALGTLADAVSEEFDRMNKPKKDDKIYRLSNFVDHLNLKVSKQEADLHSLSFDCENLKEIIQRANL